MKKSGLIIETVDTMQTVNQGQLYDEVIREVVVNRIRSIEKIVQVPTLVQKVINITQIKQKIVPIPQVVEKVFDLDDPQYENVDEIQIFQEKIFPQEIVVQEPIPIQEETQILNIIQKKKINQEEVTMITQLPQYTNDPNKADPKIKRKLARDIRTGGVIEEELIVQVLVNKTNIKLNQVLLQDLKQVDTIEERPIFIHSKNGGRPNPSVKKVQIQKVVQFVTRKQIPIQIPKKIIKQVSAWTIETEVKEINKIVYVPVYKPDQK